MTHIIKRKGHKEAYDERRLYASIYAASLAAHLDKESAEVLANLVCREINKWLEDKKEVGSNEIFQKVGEELTILYKEVALMYTTHRDIS